MQLFFTTQGPTPASLTVDIPAAAALGAVLHLMTGTAAPSTGAQHEQGRAADPQMQWWLFVVRASGETPPTAAPHTEAQEHVYTGMSDVCEVCRINRQHGKPLQHMPGLSSRVAGVKVA